MPPQVTHTDLLKLQVERLERRVTDVEDRLDEEDGKVLTAIGELADRLPPPGQDQSPQSTQEAPDTRSGVLGWVLGLSPLERLVGLMVGLELLGWAPQVRTWVMGVVGG